MCTTQLACTGRCCSMWTRGRKLKNLNSKTWKKNLSSPYTIKCGVLLIDKNEKILIVQSYNTFWGIPKGSQESDENFISTCIRETWEETGLLLSESLFLKTKTICFFRKSGLFIFFVCKLEVDGPRALFPQQTVDEITGCGWININCLKQMIKRKTLRVNFVTKSILNYF